MKEVPGAKGADAAILYYELIQDDVKGVRRVYYRIKILTEEGRKYAKVELPSNDLPGQLDSIKARVVQPDGRIVPFTGKVLDQLVARKKELMYPTEAFTLPDVQAGSIIEYKYTLSWLPEWVDDRTFYFQHKLFARKSHIALTTAAHYVASYVAFRLGTDANPILKGSVITLDVNDVPAFEEERFLPPEEEIRARFYVFYSRDKAKPPEEFWRDAAKDWKESAEKYMDKKSDMQREVNSLVQPGDPPEQKLRKIYDRVQRIRDISYGYEEITVKELKHPSMKEINNVDDMLRYGYGYRNGINRLFVALARAAGFDADIVRVVDRSGRFFHKELPTFRQVSDELGVVKLDGKVLYFSPSTPFCPYGLLPWNDTNTLGVNWVDGTVSFPEIPASSPADSVTNRNAALELSEEGALAGEVSVNYNGMGALHRRLEFQFKDDTERKKSMEEDFKESLPSGASAEVVRMGSWTGTGSLEVVFKIKIPDYGIRTGKRLIVPEYPFQGSKGHAFQQSKRTNFICFRSPWGELDKITIKLPSGYRVEKLPQPVHYPPEMLDYASQVTFAEGTLTIQRKFVMNGVFVAPEYYSQLHEQYDRVKAGDDYQIPLKAQAN